MNTEQIANNRTYDEWEKLGFRIRKGEKAISTNAMGIAMFSPSQVERKIDLTGYGWEGSEDE
jgi:hypothetical protein